MCGFTITKEYIKNGLSHRGIKETHVKHGEWFVTFNSLPLSSHNTGIDQPIKVGNFLIVFNGEIFNHKDLNKKSRSDVDYLQQTFKTLSSDPKKLYDESIKWDGFWSIAILNKEGDVYTFTDPLGKKQLYYSHIGISSEIKPVLTDYFYMDYTISSFGTNNTNFDSVNRYIPGILYKYEIKTNRPFFVKRVDYLYRNNNKDLLSIIEKSVEDRLKNNYDGISILLSGGLDSNIILHHVLKITKEIDVVTMDNGELEIVSKICNDLNIIPTIIKDEFNAEDLHNAVYHYEYSLDLGSLMPNYLLFKNCKNSLVLTGDGSDELFSGYERCKHSDTWEFDVFKELPYYHNIRLDRMSMLFTKEARNPLMSLPLLRYSKFQNRLDMVGKRHLRDLYKNILPDYIINGKKLPLRHKHDKEYNIQLIKSKHKEIWQKMRDK